uniref:Uncharacterized protein n=1 Tax=Grammatophora oceanica TaxID=210454 RepID=A0A7S1Y517_9STRA|mmetsp:Transcript_2054/g.2764  ORF Transcript_2054/g.2764 Transcript_2054/m.2764 type:complete len:162 (+) Transcript_2054:1-486(+)
MRSKIVTTVIDFVLSRGCRFLTLEQASNLFVEMSSKQVRDKVSHAFVQATKKQRTIHRDERGRSTVAVKGRVTFTTLREEEFRNGTSDDDKDYSIAVKGECSETYMLGLDTLDCDSSLLVDDVVDQQVAFSDLVHRLSRFDGVSDELLKGLRVDSFLDGLE